MHYACAEEHLEAVEVLIGLGANVDAQDNEGNSSLHVVTRTRNTAIAQLLLRVGANTEVTDQVNTPLLQRKKFRSKALLKIISSEFLSSDGVHSASRSCRSGLQGNIGFNDSTRCSAE